MVSRRSRSALRSVGATFFFLVVDGTAAAFAGDPPEPRASAAQRTVGGHRLGTTTVEDEGGAHGSRGAYDSAVTRNIRYNGRPVKKLSDPGRGSPLRSLLTFAGIGTKRRGYGARVDRDRLAARMAPPFRGISEIRPKQGRFSSGRSGFHRRPHDVTGPARRDEGDKEPRRLDCLAM